MRFTRTIRLLSLFGLLAFSLSACGNGDDSDQEPSCAEGCEDGNPCTIDFCHPYGGHCVNALDPTCTQSCESAADCPLDSKRAPCVSVTCHKKLCRYLELSESECGRCGDDTPCAGSFCDPKQCIDGFCREALRDCDDGDPNTWDRCSDSDARCKYLLTDGRRTCESDSECITDHPCQVLTCQTGYCRVSIETQSCSEPLDLPRSCDKQLKNADCIQAGDSCIAGPCMDGFCQWREVPGSDCGHCLSDADCPSTFCNQRTCTGTVCAAVPQPACVDPDPATTDECNAVIQACTHRHALTPAACIDGAEDDADPSTIDVCNTESGETAHLPSSGAPCETTNRCWFTYPSATGSCLGHPIHCNDGQSCTQESCDPSSGCMYDDKECACETDADCDDGNPCSLRICLQGKQVSGCWGALLDRCVPCTTNSECQSDDSCVEAQCASGWCTYSDQKTCDDGDPSTLGFCHSQHDEACSFETADSTASNR